MYKCVMDSILDSLRMRLLQGGCVDLTPETWNGDYPGDPFHRLYLVERGDSLVRHSGMEWQLGAGDALLIPAHADHTLQCLASCTIRFIHCEATVLGGISLFDHVRPSCHVRPVRPEAMRGLMQRLLDRKKALETGAVSAADQLVVHASLQELLSYFLQEAARPPGSARRLRLLMQLRPVLEEIEKRLPEALRVGELARLAHLERGHFCKVFRETMGVPPSVYLQRRRVERSRLLLLGSERSLEEIAWTTGFYDAYHFSRTFKRLTGIPPSEYRRRVSEGKP